MDEAIPLELYIVSVWLLGQGVQLGDIRERKQLSNVAECMQPRMDLMSMMVRFVCDVILGGLQMEGDRHSLAPELELYLAQT